jgi:nicotinamidase/pyrazinamidase
MKVLLIVDIQNDFLPGGALEVSHGDAIIPIVNKILRNFDLVVATQDWHPPDHKSFASNHENRKPGEIIKLKDLDQVLWPDHCIQDTPGSLLSDHLDTSSINRIFVKGTDPNIDSYSGFFDNGHLKSTGLGDYLKANNVDEVYIVGLATDYCVKFTALDSVAEGFKTYVIADGTRAVNLQPDDYDKAIIEMTETGVKVIDSTDL